MAVYTPFYIGSASLKFFNYIVSMVEVFSMMYEIWSWNITAVNIPNNTPNNIDITQRPVIHPELNNEQFLL